MRLHPFSRGRYSELRIMSVRAGRGMRGALVGLMLATAAPAFADARGDAKSQVEFGISVAQRGLWKEAMYRWERAVKIDPTYAAAWNNLAIAYEHEGQFEEARQGVRESDRASIRKTSSSGRTSISSRKSMTGPRAAAIASLALALAVSACTSFYEIPIETPIQAKLDVIGVQPRPRRRLHRGRQRRRRRQPRNGSPAQEPAPHEVGAESHRSGRAAARGDRGGAGRAAAAGRGAARENGQTEKTDKPEKTEKTEKPTAGTARGHLPTSRGSRTRRTSKLTNRSSRTSSFWKKLGEEFQNPLIVTGTVLFTPHSRAAFVQREQEYFDALGRRRVVPVRTYMERKGFILIPTFVFIDGRTGTRLYRECYRKEVLYPSQQNTPALSSYFELMDQAHPEFLERSRPPEIRGTRVLLK